MAKFRNISFLYYFLFYTLHTTSGQSPNFGDYNDNFGDGGVELQGGRTNTYQPAHNTSQRNELNSSPGCPEIEYNITPWVYLKDRRGKQKCYLVGTIGPCSDNEVIFTDGDSPWGYCDCACFSANSPQFNLHWEEKSKIPQWVTDNLCVDGQLNRWMLKETMTGKCYPLFSRGPCPEGQWIGMDFSKAQFTTKCKPRGCPIAGYDAVTNSYRELIFNVRTDKCEFVPIPSSCSAFSLGPASDSTCKGGEIFSGRLEKCIPNSQRFASTRKSLKKTIG